MIPAAFHRKNEAAMKKGKISESILKRSVLKYIHIHQQEIVKGAGTGSDCAFLRCGDTREGMMAVTTQTVTLPIKDVGKLAVYAAVNNLEAAGASTLAVTLAVTLPEELPETQLQEIMKQTGDTCRELGIEIAGGHTEVTDAVKTPVVTVTAVGRPALWEQAKSSDSKDMDIVMTKWLGIEGTVILSKEKKDQLLTRYPISVITAAQGFEKYLSILPEAATARKTGVYTMHDARNGGVFGALWELSRSMGVGLSIDLKKIPVKQETIEICEFFDLNPYELLAGGCLLLVTPEGEKLAEILEDEGIPSAVIGRTTNNNDKIIFNEDENRFLEPAKPDEIFKINFSEGGIFK